MTNNAPAQINETQPPSPGPDDHTTGTERVVESLGPHFPKIGIAIAVGLLALVGITLLVNNQQQSSSMPWNELSKARNEFVFSQNSDSLTRVADEYPDSKAGMWGLQLAGDVELRNGIGLMATDRENGLKAVGKAAGAYQQVVDGPASSKSPMLQQRSLFSLAYAKESLGEFEDAAKYYNQLAEQAPNSSFAAAAKRGAERASNPAFAAVYEKFVSWEDAAGDAPGPNVPNRPDISFPEFDGPAVDDDEADMDAADAKQTPDSEAETADTEEAASDGDAAGTEESEVAADAETPADDAVETDEGDE